MTTLPHEQHQGHLLRKINELQRTQLKTLLDACNIYDAFIVVDNIRFPVDRNIISCCSPYFRALFTNASMQKKLGASPMTLDERQDNHSSKTESDVKKRDVQKRGVNKRGVQERNGNETDVIKRNVNATERDVNLTEKMHTDRTELDIRNNNIPRDDPMTPRVLRSRSRSRTCTEVTVTDVRPNVMSDIIEHAYGADVTITESNFEPLLIAADMFQISSLLDKCCDYLESRLSGENCITIVRFVSHFPHCERIRLKATQFFLGNFVIVSQKSPDYLHLTVDELEAVLKADRLNVRHEVEVLDAISRWVVGEPASRAEHIPRLVRCVRIGLMYPGEVDSFANSWPQPSNPVVLMVMESVLEQQRHQLEHLDNFVFSPRLPRDILLAVGGSDFGYPLNLVEAFDCRTWTWSVVEPKDFAPRSYHGMTEVDNEIFIIGGFNGQEYLSNCCKFKPESLQWESVTPMNTKRCYVGVTVVKGSIYAVGGFDGVQRLQSAERFDKASNQWSHISPMLQQRSDAGVASLRDRLYVCGGFNGVICTHAVEMFDPLTDQWSALAAMTCPRSGPGMVTYRDCIYVLGGFDGGDNTVRLATMEVYLPDTDQWLPARPMPSARSNMAVEVLEDVLYAVGGYNGQRTTSVVEGFHFHTNTWYQYPTLNHKRSALSICKVRELSNAEELLGRNKQRMRTTNSSRS